MGGLLIRPQKQIAYKLTTFSAGKNRAGHIIQLLSAHLYAPQRANVRYAKALTVAGAYKLWFKPALIRPRPEIDPKRRGTFPAKSQKGRISRPKSAVLYAPAAENGLRKCPNTPKRPPNKHPAAEKGLRNLHRQRKTPPQISAPPSLLASFFVYYPRHNYCFATQGLPPA